MKHRIYILMCFLVCFCEVLFSQSSNQNHILIRTMQNDAATIYIDKKTISTGWAVPCSR